MLAFPFLFSLSNLIYLLWNTLRLEPLFLVMCSESDCYVTFAVLQCHTRHNLINFAKCGKDSLLLVRTTGRSALLFSITTRKVTHTGKLMQKTLSFTGQVTLGNANKTDCCLWCWIVLLCIDYVHCLFCLPSAFIIVKKAVEWNAMFHEILLSL